MADLSCGATCLKYILFIFNFIFFACGGVLVGVSIWLLVDPDMSDYTNVVDNPLIDAAIYTLLAVGILVFLIGFLGCCGACKESATMLCMYAGLIGFVFFLEIVAAILAIVYQGKLGDELEDEMVTQVKRYVTNDNKDASTAAWNTMQFNFKCCGAVNYTDYQNSLYANETGKAVPLTCCVLKEGSSADNPTPVSEARCRADAKVDGHTEDTKYLYVSGCYTDLVDWMKGNAVILIGVGFGLAAIQIFGIVFACCVRSEIKSGSY